MYSAGSNMAAGYAQAEKIPNIQFLSKTKYGMHWKH
jgi:hypothetical protein